MYLVLRGRTYMLLCKNSTFCKRKN